jgi:hypothetical protein
MLPPEDDNESGPAINRDITPPERVPTIEHPSRPMSRREFLNERRQSILQQKQTDALPAIPGDAPNGKGAGRHAKHLREENMRLRWELSNLQEQFDNELGAMHNSYQQQIVEYQNQLRDLMEDHNRMQAAKLELEQSYQQLYHNFQNAVEEEAQKMVTEAVSTVEITPEHTPVLLRDARKTIELHARQVEDKHVAQALNLMRDAQRKAQQLEQELDHERRQMQAERQSVLNFQNRVREQEKLRFEAQRTRLHAQWAGTVTVMVITSVICFLVIQACVFYFVDPSFSFSSIAAIVVCAILSLFAARMAIFFNHIRESTPHTKSVKK